MKKTPLLQKHKEILQQFGLEDSRATVLHFSPGEYLMRQGYPIPHFMLLLQGEVDVQNYDNLGRRILFGASLSEDAAVENEPVRSGQPGPIGDQELLLGRDTALNTVSVKAPTVCIALPWDNARAQLQQSVRFSNIMAYAAVAKLTSLQNNYRTVALKSGEARLCGYLLHSAADGVFRETLTETAPVVGVSYRQLQRIMQKLCAMGLVQKQQSGYLLTDKEALRALAAK